jgi:long-subunit fatty acid transport protein
MAHQGERCEGGLRMQSKNHWMTTKRVVGISLLLFVVTLSQSSPAWAGGFDTPTLYTARHMGMGGTAIGYVDDPSAGFHNPAGLQHVTGFSLIGNFSLLLGHVEGSPDPSPDARSITSQLTVAPFPLLGAAYRVHEWITVGLAVFPVASGAGAYEYDNVAGNPTEDELRLVFIEGTPLVSVNVPKDLWLPGLLSLGVGYRIDMVDFSRTKGPPGNPAVIDLDLTGFSFTGFRVGLQWEVNENWSFGAVFRNHIEVDASADDGTALGQEASDPELTFVLPAKLGVGGRFDYEAFGAAVDLEYGFFSGNEAEPLRGEIGGRPGEVSNAFYWHDAVTFRVGGEYRLGRERNFPVRLGYIHDATVSNKAYPTAFGTPPAPTNTLTAGAGVALGITRINVAYAYRFGSTTVTEDDLAPASECRFCSTAGEYAIRTHGLYVDVGADWP